jgi:S1-C subfamily serine protease
VQKVLELAGISAEFQGDRCVANSVTGPAERLGVKGGDIILTVNDVSIKPSTTFEEGVELKNVRVKRAGRNLRFSL